MDATPRQDLTDLDEGFATQTVTADLARRQLNVSLGVMGLMLAAALTVAGSTGFSRPSPEPVMPKLMVQQPHFVRALTAEGPHTISVQPGS
ncbi:MAG: hypothetical protein K2Y29_13875 [Beijerinckiaceae bacterium]|nr:hypothetical protein [Beijerinckiaceae bacterium]